MGNLKTMLKEEFTRNDFTDFLDNRDYDLSEHYELAPKVKLDINPDDWFEFLEKNWYTGLTMHYEPRHVLDATSNEQTAMANRFGYHSGNTLKRDWGKNIPQQESTLARIANRYQSHGPLFVYFIFCVVVAQSKNPVIPQCYLVYILFFQYCSV